MNHTPKPIVISARASVYAKSPTQQPGSNRKEVEMPPIDVRQRIIQDIVTEALPLEGIYLRACYDQAQAFQKNGRQDHFMKQKVQFARQRLNSLIALRKHSIAQVLGLHDSEFTSKYLPRTLDGLWFCRDENASMNSPVDFLRAQLQILDKERANSGSTPIARSA